MIGYLDLREFVDTKYTGDTAVSAMNFFANCNALIIDLRKNGGGWDEMVTFLMAFIIDANESQLLSVSHSKLDGTYYSSIISSYVPGARRADIPTYILTSRSTASAAEGFTHKMKLLNKNVTQVVENTAGAENPVDFLILDDQFILKIPCWRKIFSITESG
ncbi:S41 family peptidase [candidate division CSSED10-310 bacterium]|uniref:S41 family peptidase n=1 Tax=candidate division CSSED10-310 bacterium TaxID=2855610 RepID=A0ABV6YZQ1_UNCC1